jgi:hypothetical protein
MRFQFTLDDYPQNIDGVIMFPSSRLLIQAGMIFMCLRRPGIGVHSQSPVTNQPPSYGPFHAVFLLDGDGRNKLLAKNDSGLQTDSSCSLYGGVKPAEGLKTAQPGSGLGRPRGTVFRFQRKINGRSATIGPLGKPLVAPATISIPMTSGKRPPSDLACIHDPGTPALISAALPSR